MKKIILACATAILSLSFINAQTEEGSTYDSRRILLGATAGVNMTTYSGDRNAEMGLGGQFGINCDIPVNESFSVMPELIFSYKTVKLDNIVWDTSGDVLRMESTDNLFYMNVPITVKWGMEMGPGRPFVALGPMISVGLFGHNKMKDAGEDDTLLLFQSDPNSYLWAYREKPIYNNLDFSAYLKLGYDFDFGLSTSLAFQYGFVNMYKQPEVFRESGLKDSQTSMTFSFSIGYSY